MSSYYDQPILKRPVWTWEIPWYFATGGAAGGSSVLAVAARLAGDDDLARRARMAAAGAAAVSPILLVSDLGRPTRFHHMMRVMRPTSPMNVGSWLLAVYAPAAVGAAVLGGGRAPLVQRLAEYVAAALGPGIATYTAVLVADTAVPVWHEARRELPFVFAGGATAAAGALAMLARPGDATAARRVAVVGSLAAEAAVTAMKHRLGGLGRPYQEGPAGALSTAARAASLAGAAVAAVGRGRMAARAAASLTVAGTVLERWAVFRAGFQSADDPASVVESQRRGGAAR